VPLERRTPLRSRPKGKGNGGEREIVDMLHRFGWKYARRNLASG
jgi:Holliday junction resolvase